MLKAIVGANGINVCQLIHIVTTWQLLLFLQTLSDFLGTTPTKEN